MTDEVQFIHVALESEMTHQQYEQFK